ncbi:MAG: hypothetical protein OXH75_24120, partial [Acidobacteria bacterium]|nr:hypothetical protein [Acidobacteriota bacterium]
MREAQASTTQTRGVLWRVAVMLALLVPAWNGLASNVSAQAQEADQPEEAEGRTDAPVETLARALGLTPAEVEALGLSPAEIRSLLAGFAEETVVVGSRAEPRSATESAV